MADPLRQPTAQSRNTWVRLCQWLRNQRSFLWGTVIVGVTFNLFATWLIMPSGNTLRIYSLSPAASPTPSLTPTNPPSSINPAIIAALIGLAGVVVGALLTGVFALYQRHRTAQIEQERQQEQFRHDQEMARLQKELELQYQNKAQEQQRQTTENAATQSAMLHAKTTAERVQAYREALHADSRIARLQILDMNRPLTVTDIYIRVRLHQETRLGYELDPTLLDAEARRDPNELLKVGRLQLESRASSALEPYEAIRTYRRCVIVGDPGAGKTTLLKYLALQSVDQRLPDLPDLPIHVELNVFANSAHRDLLEFASSVWEERYGFPKADALAYMQDTLKDGKALVLLDALDETIAGTTKEEAEESYKRAAKAITDLATRYHQAPIVVTARKAGYHQRTRLVGFTELEVLDFRPEDITQFVGRWFACHPNLQKRADAADLNTRLERNPRISALAANPLLLSLIVIVYEDQLDLPDRRAELYRQCVETLLTKWDASRDIRRRREFKPEHKRQLLEQVAWHFHLQGQRYFPDNALLRVIAQFLPIVGLPEEQNGQVLDEIATENGLLKEQARGWYGLLHLTLQEYFAAQYAVDHQELDTLLEHRGEPWWEEVLSLYAGRIPDASLLLERLLEPGNEPRFREDLFQTNLLLAGECLAAKPAVKRVSFRSSVITRLLESLTTTPYALTRQQLAEALAKIGGVEVNAHLLHLLADKQVNASLRMNIALALGSLGERSVTPDLLRLLVDEQEDFSLRMNIALALGSLGERSVARELLRFLSDESHGHHYDALLDKDIRASIASTLGMLGERSAAPELLRLLSKETFHHPPSRERIAESFCMLERSVVPELLRLLSDESLDIPTRADIAAALGTLGERSVVPELVRLLSDGSLDSEIRGGIAFALGMLGERSVAPELLRLLSDSSFDGNTHLILRTTDRGPGFASPDTPVRTVVALALGMLGERSVAPELLRLLSDDSLNGWVRGGIALALTVIGEPSIARDLIKLLSDENIFSGLRWLLAYDLGELGERSIVPDLVHLLSDGSLDSEIRWGIAHTLGTLGERSVVPELLRLLSDESLDSEIRGEIAAALGTLGERSVVPELLRLLSDDLLDKDIRKSIGRALVVLN